MTLFTDDNPFELIFKKQLQAALMRHQRMLLALQWYDITVTYRKVKDMQLPDTLSRAYLQESVPEIDINCCRVFKHHGGEAQTFPSKD